jgi:hypothetical protein
MTLVMYVVAAAMVTTGLFLGIDYFVRAYICYRDSRLITCPQNGAAAMVEVDAVHAAVTSILGSPDIRLRDCWRWPIHQACGQECLLQFDVAPPDCLVRGVLMRWYEFKACALCGKTFGQVHPLGHKPALQSPGGKLMNWDEVETKGLYSTLATCEPVCWECYDAQSSIAA